MPIKLSIRRLNLNDIQTLRSRPLNSLLKEAWAIRQKNFEPILTVSAPSAKTYITDHYKNKKNTFVNISLTGTSCALNCEHCKRKLLDSMIPATTPERLKEVGDALMEKGCSGVLLSGGADESGSVPLADFFEVISYLKNKGLRVIVHTGLIKEETAVKLKEVAVDQVLIDIIGDQDTISNVYHLNKTPEDFKNSLRYMKNVGLNIAPHIVIGLNFGKVIGEYNAISMISEVEPDVIVIVILSPMHDTPMFGTTLPTPTEITRITAITRIMNPNTPLTLGCVRPAGVDKFETEKMVIQAGINGITYPMDETIEFCEGLGLKIEYRETCCSLLTI
jgi:uncharacterized radical SAM superfamily protein